MPDAGILDTSVVIDLPAIDDRLLPAESAITAVTLAELGAGPQATADAIQRSIRADPERMGGWPKTTVVGPEEPSPRRRGAGTDSRAPWSVVGVSVGGDEPADVG